MAYPYGGPSVQGQTLELHVVGCYNLSDKEWFTRQDPYVVIEYSGQKFRTRTDTDGGKNPSFNETFRITLIEGVREINAKVWNSNTIERDDYIGSAKILLNKVIDTGYDDTQWPLSNSRTGKSSGSLKLIMHYAGSAKTKASKFEGSSQYSQASPSMHYGQPAPAYGQSAVPAYGQYPPQESVLPYPPPPAGYGPPPTAAQVYRPVYPGPAPPATAYPPGYPSPAQSPFYPPASAPPYGSGPPTSPPPPGYPPAGGYPQNRPYY